jgi:hypothetical protein
MIGSTVARPRLITGYGMVVTGLLALAIALPSPAPGLVRPSGASVSPAANGPIPARAWLDLAFAAPPPAVRIPGPWPTPYGTVTLASTASGLVARIGTTPTDARVLYRFQDPTNTFDWVRATGPWLIYRRTRWVGRRWDGEVGALYLAAPGTPPRLVYRAAASTVAGVAVGSHRVAVLTPTGVLVWTLPEAPDAPAFSITVPTGDWPLVQATLFNGYDAGSLRLPGLPTHAPRYPGLVRYTLGTFQVPLMAPPGWMVVPPSTRRGLTAVQIVNPTRPDEWVAVILNPHGRMLTVPPSARATVALSDVTLAFFSPGPHHIVYNGVLYPNPRGGTSEILVALPASQHTLATHILDSVGLPY